MELPVHKPGLQPRTLSDVQSLAVAVQANLVQLRVEAQRRKIDSLSDALLGIAAPGVVREFRETLLDRQVIKQCTDLELLLQLHENWGQFCAISWLLSGEPDDDGDQTDSQDAPAKLKCDTSIRVKLAEVHAYAWRFRFELERRKSLTASEAHSHTSDTSTADQIPATAFGKPVGDLNESGLMLATCEHVGLMRVLRWSLDHRSHWLDSSLSTINDKPFPEADFDQ